MKSIKLISSALLMLICFLSYGQERTVTGCVSDKDEVLPFVTILVKGTHRTIQTDIEGKFSIKVKTGDVLILSYVGYETQKIKIKKRTTVLNVILKSNVVLLSETYDDPIQPKRILQPTTTVITKEQLEKP